MLGILDPTSGYILLCIFAVVMFLLTAVFSKKEHKETADGFMAAGRSVPWWLGAISIAVSWIWAPALFVSVQQAYQQGVPGVFWFTLPNILCLFIMAPLAIRIREFFPQAFTQPEWIRHRFDRKTHILYLIPFFWYQVMAVTVQLYAGGSIFAVLTGAKVEYVMIVLAGTTLAYGIISGMRASIVTDFIQYVLIVVGGLIVIPWTVINAGGFTAILGGLGGVTGQNTSLFDINVAWNFGIVTSIGLISGVLSDQQHWQRAFTVKKAELRKAYIFAGILFGIVPISLSLLGFIAANPELGIKLPNGVDPSMVGVVTVAHYLPAWAVVTFLVMLSAGLCSTLDSAMCAAASLFAANCFPSSEDRTVVKRGRIAMILITLVGLVIAFLVLKIPGFGLKYLWWVFNTIAACVAVPTVLSLYWNKLSSKGVFWGVLIAFFVGIPSFVYGNIVESTKLIVGSSLFIILVTAISAYLLRDENAAPLGANISK